MTKLIKIGKKGIIIFLTMLALGAGAFPSIRQAAYPLHYYDILIKNAALYRVDPYLVAAVIKAESKFKPEAVSSRGAMGLMQIMPSTGEWAATQLGLVDFKTELLLDPEINIKLGTWYLAGLKKEFAGNLPRVIAAYNSGRGNVRQWINDGIWQGTYEDRQNIPFSETQRFLERVWKNYASYRSIYAGG
ncbi:MAG TPA: lytic transglycosylase domain-containing protein [Firmicutes bacterium]|nr:lytic transglycosylase domain-containing protein [Bacillota bacterium]